ncbi:unnamed protein product [Brachionus calyciflorus]|uniref:Uncharacterized protein n=1 Tax=Brachionus calyciflorus TaxID=104777 RepID=A0A813Q4K5_9BILA|nr:unnamed protein product [Brachionus calyciflorus]
MEFNGFGGLGLGAGGLGIGGIGGGIGLGDIGMNGFTGAGFGGGLGLGGGCVDVCRPVCPQPCLQTCDIMPQQCEAQPVIINQDVSVPRPVVIRKQTVPIPFLPYCRRTSRGYPKW